MRASPQSLALARTLERAVERAVMPLRRHRWTYRGSVAPEGSRSGCEEHERVCELCGLIKITVHQPRGFPYRAWRTRGGTRFSYDVTPLCEDAD